MDLARFNMDLAHYEITTTHTAIYIVFLWGMLLATSSFLQKVSWDLFFGACHFLALKLWIWQLLLQNSPQNKV